MRIIKRAALAAFWRRHPQAKSGLEHWYAVTKAARWASLTDVRATFPHADPVKVASGRTVVVFNAGGNKVRLITAIHYDRGRVFTLRVLTHDQYDEGKWKDEL